MANVLRYQTGSGRFRPFVGGLEPLDERAGGEPMPAPPNASGILERNVIPEGQGQDAQRFQLQPPGDLSMQPRDDTPTLDRLTLRNAPEPRLDYGRQSVVEGLPSVPPPPMMQMGGGAARAEQAERDRRMQRRLGASQIALSIFGLNRQPVSDAFAQGYAGIEQRGEQRRADEAAEVAGRAAAEQQAYDRASGERRLDLDERRIAQTEAATQQRLGYRDADIDPNHPNAENERTRYAFAFGALPGHIRAAFPAYDPSNPAVAQVLDGIGAEQIRRLLEDLKDQYMVRFPDEADWRNVGRTGGGGRLARGQLAGLSAPARVVRRGDAGLTPEQILQMDASGVDEMQVGEPAIDAPMPAEPRARVRGGGAPRALRPQAPGAPAPAAAAAAPPPGRPLLDRPMTPAELDAATPQVRRTQILALAEQRRHLGTPWRDAIGVVNGMQPAAQDQLLAEWGSAETDRVPGWQRVRDVPLTPAALNNAREAVTQFETIKAASRRIIALTQQINAANIAEDALWGHPLVRRWVGESRRIQTALREIDHTGVPTGNEQIRAMEEAPEPSVNNIAALLRAAPAYNALPQTLGANLGVFMQQQGYAPVRPGGRR